MLVPLVDLEGVGLSHGSLASQRESVPWEQEEHKNKTMTEGFI